SVTVMVSGIHFRCRAAASWTSAWKMLMSVIRVPGRRGPAFRSTRIYRQHPGLTPGEASSGVELLLQFVQHFVAGEDAAHAGVGLTAFADGGEELAVLQLDAVHAHVHLGDVDLLFLAGVQVV